MARVYRCLYLLSPLLREHIVHSRRLLLIHVLIESISPRLLFLIIDSINFGMQITFFIFLCLFEELLSAVASAAQFFRDAALDARGLDGGREHFRSFETFEGKVRKHGCRLDLAVLPLQDGSYRAHLPLRQGRNWEGGLLGRRRRFI